MRSPDFLIVGAAKSGTTSLWQYLGQHPQIYMTQDIQSKELGYYCYHYGVKEKTKYLEFFKDANSSQLIGESCHAYLSSPESAELIFQDIPETKIIIILRNPIDRAYSLYNWMSANGYENAKNFETALNMEESRIFIPNFIQRNPQGFYMNYYYFRSGLYYEQVERYLKLFGKERCKIFIFEELNLDWKKGMNEIFSFLGVDNTFQPEIKIHNESIRVRNAAIQFYLRFKFRKKLKKIGFSDTTSTKIIKKLMRMNTRSTKPSKMNPETRSKLLEKYRPDIQKTSDLLSINLSRWLE